ncbi:MAG TPA: alpha/beta hydrolase [Chloroflexi bacterium]|nr:alpha/beta hydrolase [Chloroflexota bacterium]
MKHSEGTFETFDGLQLYHQSWMPEGKARATLAIVHGFGEHSGRYGNLVDYFVPRGCAVHAFDLRGHGRSPGARGYVERWDVFRNDVRAFLAVLQKQAPGTPLFLLGHSMGGLIVLEYVLRDPGGLAGVVASGPLLAQAGVSPLLALASKLLSLVLPRLTLDVGLDATALSRDPAVVEAYASDPLVHGQGTPRLGQEIARAYEWAHAHATDMRIPCLIVHGSADRLAPPEASRVFYEHVTFEDKARYVYDGYYHEVFNEIGKEHVLADVEQWLTKHQT